jgi:hypothetical protein
MVRILGSMSMAALFLIISPGMRETAREAAANAQGYVTAHGPYSYAALLAIAFAIMLLLARSLRGPAN